MGEGAEKALRQASVVIWRQAQELFTVISQTETIRMEKALNHIEKIRF